MSVICPQSHSAVHPKMQKCISIYKWRAPWKNQICSTTMKLRKSLVKPVMQQTSCLFLPPEIVMHDAFNVILWMSANIWVVHDDLGWKNWAIHYNCMFFCHVTGFTSDFLGQNNRTTRYNCMFWRARCSRLEYVDIRSVY